MELVPANPALDPQVVVTPLSPDRAEEILCKYSLYKDWKHIITGLRKGFDVGVRETPPHSYIFHQPCFVTFRPRLYIFLHCQRTSSRPLFRSLHPRCLRVHNRSIPNIPTRTGSQATLEQAPTWSRHVVSQERSQCSICQCRGEFRRFSHILGHLRQHSGAHTFPSLGCIAATFDITAAYRLMPVHPNQQHALCIFWNGLVYVDRAVMFSLTSSTGVFGAVANMLVTIYGAANFGLIRKWVDNFLAIRLPHQTWTEKEFMDPTGYFGVPWSIEKLCPFSSIQRYISFDWDLERKSVALPKEKLQATQLLMKEWQHPDMSFSAREAASLHRKLVHVSCIFPLIRPFLHSISFLSQNFTSPRAKLHATPSVQHDLSWIHFLLHQLPNEVPLMNQEIVDLNWWGDASTSFGIGVVLGEFFTVWKYAPGFQASPKEAFDIGWAEAVAVELSLCLAIQFQLLRGSDILVHSDNSGIVTVMNKGQSRSLEMNKILKHVYTLQAKTNIRLHATYVSSHDNISDALSRGQISEFLRGFPLARTQVIVPLLEHLIDKLIPWL